MDTQVVHIHMAFSQVTCCKFRLASPTRHVSSLVLAAAVSYTSWYLAAISRVWEAFEIYSPSVTVTRQSSSFFMPFIRIHYG